MRFKSNIHRLLLIAFCQFTLMASMKAQTTATTQVAPLPEPVRNPTPNLVIASINSMDALDTKRTLEPGDIVAYRVVQDGATPPLSLRVSDGGELEVPLIGRVQAGGLTCKQVATNIKTALEKVYYKKATVIVGLESVHQGPRGRIFVTGQVQNQGPIELPSSTEQLTVSTAILQAGGFSDFANKRKVRVMRKLPDNTTEKIIVDVKDIIEGGKLEKDVILQSGDVIFVPERMINF